MYPEIKSILLILLFIMASCTQKGNSPSKEELSAIDLKRGDIVMCGPGDQKFGDVAHG